MSALAIVVIPARDEEGRIGSCLAALAVQAGVAPGDVEVIVVLDDSQDGTAQAVEAARRAHPWLPVTVLEGAGLGAGIARREGMIAARERAPRMLCSTDADSRVGRDWIAAQLAALRGGAGAVGGRVELDAAEAAALDPDLLAARAVEGRARLQIVRGWAPEAEHHQFSAASIGLTCAAYDAVGGFPELAELEDEALEHELRAAGVRIVYPRGVHVTTSARRGGRLTRPMAVPEAPAPGRVVLVAAGPGRRGAALREALRGAAPEADIVVSLPHDLPDTGRAAEALIAPLLADERLTLVKAAASTPHPLEEVVARPMLELHAPPLAALRSPLSAAWATRRSALEGIELPSGDAADLAVLVDTWRTHGLPSIAQVPVELPAPVVADPGALAYDLLATVGERTASPVPGDARERLGTLLRGSTPTSAW